MKLNFRALARLLALAFSTLAIVWMFAPTLLLSDWGVQFNGAVGLVGRRDAALYAGIAVMFFLARNADPSPARSALIRGSVFACLMLAALGIYELAAGHATPAILIAAFIEIVFTLALLYVGREQSETLLKHRGK